MKAFALTRSVSIIAASALLLGGCLGDGGSSSPAPSSSTPPPATTTSTTTLSGVAMAAAINGTVCAYPLSDTGTVGSTALGCGTTAPTTGAYSISWNDYVGGVIIKAFGSYLDEATGLTKNILEANPLRASANCTGSTCQAAVTPLTEAAIRSAGALTPANLAAAYFRVAQAFGQNPGSNADAFAKLVTLLPATSGNDSAAQYYARALALVSQMQIDYCASTCTLDTYLTGLQSLLGNTSGVADVQTAMNAALATWSSNPKNTSHMDCYFSGNVLTCNLPNPGGDPGNGSGNYSLAISVTVMGNTTAAATINNVAKPSTQGEFCNSAEINEQTNSQMAAYPGATWTLNSCSFSGNGGTMDMTIHLTTPMVMTIPYSATYTYSAM